MRSRLKIESYRMIAAIARYDSFHRFTFIYQQRRRRSPFFQSTSQLNNQTIAIYNGQTEQEAYLPEAVARRDSRQRWEI